MYSEKHGRKRLKRANKNRQYSSSIARNFVHVYKRLRMKIRPLVHSPINCHMPFTWKSLGKTTSSIVLVLVAYIILQSVEWSIEDKAFSPANDLGAPPSYTPPPSPVSKLSLFLSLPVWGAKSYYGEKAWSFINHSILSALSQAKFQYLKVDYNGKT
jgi:hypothetical protein